MRVDYQSFDERNPEGSLSAYLSLNDCFASRIYKFHNIDAYYPKCLLMSFKIRSFCLFCILVYVFEYAA